MCQRRRRRSHKKSGSQRRKDQAERAAHEAQLEAERRALPECISCSTTEGLFEACNCEGSMKYYCFPCVILMIKANYDFRCNRCSHIGKGCHYGNRGHGRDPRIVRTRHNFRREFLREFLTDRNMGDLLHIRPYIIVLMTAFCIINSIFCGMYFGWDVFRSIDPIINVLIIFFHLMTGFFCVLFIGWFILFTEYYMTTHRQIHTNWIVNFYEFMTDGSLRHIDRYDVCHDRRFIVEAIDTNEYYKIRFNDMYFEND